MEKKLKQFYNLIIYKIRLNKTEILIVIINNSYFIILFVDKMIEKNDKSIYINKEINNTKILLKHVLWK